jgi:hypothetical protein
MAVRNRYGAIVAMIGILAAVASICPWAHSADNPAQATYAGPVGPERLQVLLLGFSITVIAIAAMRTKHRWIYLMSAATSLLLGVVTVTTIREVASVVKDTADMRTVVGWALYFVCACSLAGVVASVAAMKPAQSRAVMI